MAVAAATEIRRAVFWVGSGVESRIVAVVVEGVRRARRVW